MAKGPISARFLRTSRKIVRPYLRRAMGLGDFLAAVEGRRSFPRWLGKIKGLTLKQREFIVQQAIVLLEGFYAHLPLKRAMYAIDPLQRLRLLQHRLPQYSSDTVFHAEMMDIFRSLRDRHTIYLLPPPFQRAAAWLPFKVESYWHGQGRGKRGRNTNHARKRRRYLVSHVAPGFSQSTFRKGVELLNWNGVPIARAVELAVAQSAGNSPEARHGLGLQLLTARALETDPLPAAEWVAARYRTLAAGAEDT